MFSETSPKSSAGGMFMAGPADVGAKGRVDVFFGGR